MVQTERFLISDLVWHGWYQCGGQVLGVDDKTDEPCNVMVQLDRKDLVPNPRWCSARDLELVHRWRA